MKLYHYTTFAGSRILESRVIEPSNVYSNGLKHNTNVPWPKLVFLTQDPNWEPTVQAVGNSGFYERTMSDPDTYTYDNIPCWRFTVELDKELNKLMYPHPLWLNMLKDGQSLGSDVSKWHWVEHKVNVSQCHKWIKSGWRAA